MYPITQLVINSLNDHNDKVQRSLSTKEIRQLIARKFSNSRSNKAFKRTDDILAGIVKTNMAGFLSESLNIDLGKITSAIEKTIEQQREENRVAYLKRIGPHLYVETGGRVSQPTFAAMLHSHFKIIQLGRSIVEKPISRQIAIVKEVVKGHQLDNLEPLPIFGQIVGYRYCPDPKHTYPLDIKGKLIGLNIGPPEANPGRVTVSGKNMAF